MCAILDAFHFDISQSTYTELQTGQSITDQHGHQVKRPNFINRALPEPPANQPTEPEQAANRDPPAEPLANQDEDEDVEDDEDIDEGIEVGPIPSDGKLRITNAPVFWSIELSSPLQRCVL